ncbi:hypothetical protein UCRPC4_g05345 [Phaeomoniella chlamydospora]|uniref:Duf1168 domain protein n=1 Tax=Phaeomoniella chlamydospora TaxID=158046 RepID=A0A0G2E3R7_PHACM|nr:hypothetical protein UCRPC4_g05345 [Phaeomoniella chlamydospora]
MSEPIPESIPTSADPRSRRPIKKSRPNPSANPLAADVTSLFADSEKEVILPPTSAEIAARQAAIAASSVPEIVTNVQGSSAGAGSGEFHVYKASRRREYDRVKKMEEEVEKEKADAEWEKKQEARRREVEEKRAKNRAKRDKKKGKGKKGPQQQQQANGATNGPKIITGLISREDSKGDEESDEQSEQVDGAVANPDMIGVVIHDDD